MLAAALERSGASTATTLIAAGALTVAGAGVWLSPAVPASRVALLAPAAMLLVIATAVDHPLTAASQANARAAGPLALALVTASVLRSRPALALALLGGIIAGPLHMLLYDPYSDPRCSACVHATIAVWADPERAAAAWWLGMIMALLGALVGLLQRQFELLAVLLATAAFASDPYRRGLLVLAVALATSVWARRCWGVGRRHVALRRMVSVHEHNGRLVTVLRRFSSDSTLEVAFPAPDGQGFVDAQGVPLAVPTDGSFTDVAVHRDVLARVHHAASTRIPDFSVGLDPEIALKLRNECLNAQLAARVDTLSRQRRRVVDAGLAERRALERDLHDGVQQELLALGLDVRLMLVTLPEGSADAPALEQALSLVHDCVDQVRAISTGVSPPMLETLGLRAAGCGRRSQRCCGVVAILPA